MAGKATFSPDEWKQVLEGVFMAGLAVTAADPSGLWGTLKESFASAQALLEAKQNTAANELIKSIVADLETSQGRTATRDAVKATLQGSDRSEIKTRAVAALREAARIVDQKAPADAPAFKEWLLHISRQVADASSEGGFLGIGGVPVSEAEKATISDIASALAARV
jgi:hypothetical protein